MNLKFRDLFINKFIYKYLVNYILSNEIKFSDEDLCVRISKICHFAWENYPGILADPRVEELLRRIAIRNIKNDAYVRSEENNNSSRKVLHIATSISKIGGHSRIIRNWILQDNTSKSYIYLTKQFTDLPKLIYTIIDLNHIYISKETSYLNKAQELLKFIAEYNFDYIILHIHPDDIIPNLTFNFEGLPPVLFYNHADHVFSLGSTISNAIIDFREKGQKFSIERRFADNSLFLPYPLEPIHNDIGIDHNKKNKKMIFLTMARPYKFKPIDNINIFKIFDEILHKKENAELWVLGLTKSEYVHFADSDIDSSKIKFLGSVEQPYKYLSNADYFVEPFPFGTALGGYDTCRLGAIPIFNPIDYSIYGSSLYTIFPNELRYYKTWNLKEYKQYIFDLIDGKVDLDFVKIEFQEYFKSLVGESWKKRIEELYTLSSEFKIKKNRRYKIKFYNDEGSIKHAYFFSNSINSRIGFLIGIISKDDVTLINRFKLMFLFIKLKLFDLSLFGTRSLIKLILY